MFGDLRLYETGNGGDIRLLGNDIESIEGFQNFPYIAWFGGNIAADTETDREPNTEAFDYWGNSLEVNQQPVWFNSVLERTLKNTSLTPQGIRLIEIAAKKDLEFMRGFAEVKVEVINTGIDRLEIKLLLRQTETGTETIFSYIWNATNQELQ